MAQHKIKRPNTTAEWNSIKNGVQRLSDAIDLRLPVYSKLGKAELLAVKDRDKVLKPAYLLWQKLNGLFAGLDNGDN